MALLNPLYLLGFLAVGVPLYLHLRKKPPSEEQEFSSLMFLEASPEKKTRRRQVDELLLLLLRCAMLGLLALLFARPFLRSDDGDAAGSSRRMLVLLDQSASMQRGTLWEQAVRKVEELAESAKPEDELALHLYSDHSRPLLTLSQWKSAEPADRKALLLDLLKDVKPGWRGTETGKSLMDAAEMIREENQDSSEEGELVTARPGRLEVHLVGDLQTGGRTQVLQSYSWPEEVELIVTDLEAEKVGNASLHLVGSAGHPGAPEPVRVRIANDKLSSPLDLTVKREDTGASVASVRLQPGASRVIALPEVVTGSGSLLLEGDDNQFDNRVFYALPEPRALRLVVLGDDQRNSPSSPLFYLERAFPDAGLLRPDIHLWKEGPVPVDPDLLVVVGTVPEALHGALREQIEEGRRALCILLPEADSSFLARLDAGSVSGEAEVERYALLEDLDFDSLLLQPFAEARTRDFSKIRFWKHRQWVAPDDAKILANFDSGDPAWGSVPLGEGRVFVFASGWQPADSQFALSTKFVPLLHSLVREAGTARAESDRHLVGDPLPLLEGKEPVTAVVDPAGKKFALDDFEGTDQPGLFVAETAEGKTRTFAVHLDPNESETAPIGTEAISALGAPAEGALAVAASAAELEEKPELISDRRDAEHEARQKWWRWLLLATLLFFLIESWRAGRQPELEQA